MNFREATDDLFAMVEATEVTCFGGADATIIISNPTGGSGAWEVSIGNGWFEVTTTTPYIFTGLATGEYRVTIRDKAAPATIVVLEEAIEITQPDRMNAVVTTTNVRVPFTNEGSITISNPVGGYDNYEVSIDNQNWLPVSALVPHTFENLAAGFYTIRMRDADVPGCFVILADNLEISQPEILTATVSKTNITCFGAANGTITISNPTGGDRNYEVTINGNDWFPMAETYTFANLAVGQYFALIRIQGDLYYAELLSEDISITEPGKLNATAIRTNITCFGLVNGTIVISNPQGGSGTWQYSINAESWQPSGTFTGLAAGTYTARIRDAANPGCSETLGSYTITSPAILAATVEKTDLSENTATDGTITVSAPTGGSGTFEVSINGTNWFTLISTYTFSSLPAGRYDVTMRDKAVPGCFILLAEDLHIARPNEITATVVRTNVTCNGATNGTITISNPTGGNGSYEVSIDGTAWVTFTASYTFINLPPGIYDVYLRNAGETTYFVVIAENLTIFEPDILAGEISGANLTCFGTANGSITVTNPRGGSASYQFRLNSGPWQTSGVFVNLPAGAYVVHMRDARYPECTRELGTINLTQPEILASAVVKTDKTCVSDGSITIAGATGGSGNYEYSINGGQTWQSSNIFSGLNPGFYNVRIRDKASASCTNSLATNLEIKDLPDTTPPVITCPPTLVVPAAQDQVSVTVTQAQLGIPAATDNCTAAGEILLSSNLLTLFPGGVVPVGTHSITWTAEDASGNKGSCIMQLVVSNNEYPVITCPGTLSKDIDPGQCYATINPANLGVPVVSDQTTPAGNLIVTNNFGSLFPNGQVPAGSHFITWTVEDSDGYTSTCQQQIIVRDDQLPLITCPPALTDITTDPGQCHATILNPGTPVVSDNCTPASQLIVTNNAPAGNRFPAGTTTVIWTVRDASGNESTCAQMVTVRDLQSPSMVCPVNITLDASAGWCDVTLIIPVPTATDNCSATVTGVRDDGLAMNEPYSSGVTTITWTATDPSGNKTVCVQTVTVRDTQKPQITCQPDIIRNALPGACSAAVSITPPTATDNCSVTVAGIRSDGLALNEPYPAGVTTITWTAADPAGNTAACVQHVTVTDSEPPVIACPPAYSQVVEEGQNYAVITVASLGIPVATDNCPLSNLTISNNFSALFPDGRVPQGSHQVTWRATDASGNSAECQQTVIAGNAPDPGITCPPAVQVTAPPGECEATILPAALGIPTLTNVPDPSKVTVTNNFSLLFPGGKVPGGTHLITWTLVHTNGFTASCQQSITVADTQAPQIAASPLVNNGTYTVPADQGSCSATLSRSQLATLVTLADNCGVAGLTLTYLAGNSEITGASYSFPSGTTSLVVTVTDKGGNQALTALLVTVTDTEAPAIACPSKVTLATQAGLTYATITEAGLGTPVVSDNCTPAGSLTVSSNFNTLFPAGRIFSGVHNVTWTVRDQAGNTSTCQQTVEVNTITTVTSLTVTPVSRQYSDVVTLTATVTPFTVSAQSAAQSVTFRIGAQDLGTVPVTNGNAILTAALLESVAGALSPGEKSVTAVFNGVGNLFTVINPSSPLTIQSEDAVVIQNGQEAMGSDGVIALMAVIQDIDDNFRGDIRKACVSFVNRQTGQVIVSGLTPTLVDPNDPTIGVVRYNWNTGSPTGTAYKVGVVVGCYYSRDNTGEDANVVVSTPMVAGAALEVKAYPNPFSERVFFDMNFNSQGNALLEVFDNRGAKIATLLDRQVTAGEAFKLEYAPQNLVSGMVIYRLTLNGEEITGRITYRDK